MRAIPTLQDFIDDELLRAPMTLELVVDAVVDLWRIRHSSVLRRGADPVRLLQQQRGKLVADSLRALRVATETEGRGATFSARPTRPRPPAAPTSLSLIGDDDVAVDIEIAHCTATAKLQAENELRDLQTYTSALVHDLNVSRDTNPFRPECFVQALWTGVQALPISRTAQAAFLHDAAAPLANQLRRSYASACQRLAEQGVTPAAHRTIVFGGGTAWGADLGRYRPPDDLNSLRDSMPAALDEVPRAPAHAKPVALDDARTTSNTAAPAVPQVPDPQLVELLARLFDAIQRHCGLAADTAALLKRLQPAVQRMALRDPSLLDTYDHPAWLFMNHLAHDIECSSAAHRLRLVGLGRNLVDHLVATESPDGDRFDWALERLALARRQALAQVLLAAAPDIDRLLRIAGAHAAPTTSTMPLDIGSLDTVPADLLVEHGQVMADKALDNPAPDLALGQQLRVYLQGEWRQLFCLWQDHGHELVLFREPALDRLWALRQRTFALLLSQGLVQHLHVRSLVRRAAGKVMRAL